MAYNFKNLADVELLDTMPESANVLVEVDGTTKRAPSTGLGGGGSVEPIFINTSTDPMTASIPFEEAWALSVPELTARLYAGMSLENCFSAVSVGKFSTLTWGHHIAVEFHPMETSSGGVLCVPVYIVWTEGDSFVTLPGGMP